MKIRPALISAFICLVWLCSSQTSFINPVQQLLLINPSFAGTNGLVRNQSAAYVQPGYRSVRPYGVFNSTDTYVKQLNAGISVNTLQESFKPVTTGAVYLGYAQHFTPRSGSLKIIPSVQIGYSQKTFDNEWLMFLTSPPKNQSSMTVNSALLLNYKGIYFGFTSNNLAKKGSYTVYDRMFRESNVYLSYNVKPGKNLEMNCSFMNQNVFAARNSQIAVNTLLFNAVIVGVGWQEVDAFYVTAGYRHTYFTVQGAYVQPYSRLAGYSPQIYQLSASFNLRPKETRNAIANFEEW